MKSGKFHKARKLCIILMSLTLLLSNAMCVFAEEGDNSSTEQTVPAGTVNISQAEYDSMVAQMEELKNTITLLEASLEDTKNSETAKESQIRALEEKISSLNQALNEKSNQISYLQSQNSSLSNENSSLSSRNSSLTNQNSSLTSKNSSLTSQNESLKNQNSSLNSQLQATKVTTTASVNQTAVTPVIKEAEVLINQEKPLAEVTDIQDETVSTTEVTSKINNSSMELPVEDIVFDFEDDETVGEYESRMGIMSLTTSDDMTTGGFGDNDIDSMTFTEEEKGIEEIDASNAINDFIKTYRITKLKILLVVEIIVGIIAITTLILLVKKAKKDGFIKSKKDEVEYEEYYEVI